MSVQEGLEPKAVRAAGERIESLGKQVSGIQDDGNAMLKVLAAVWEGPDLGTFESGWSEAGPQVAQAAETLRAAGAELRRQAEDQVRASDGEGSRGGGGGGWGWPDWDLPDFDFPDLNPFDGWDWDLPDIDWPTLDVSAFLDGAWDDFLDLLEDIGDWWDDIPWWGQLIIGVVAVVIGVVVAIFLGLEVLAALAAVALVVGIVMTFLDIADALAEFFRDPGAFIQKVLDDPWAALENLIWFGVGLIPFGIGKVLQRLRKPFRELVENAAPWLKKKWDDVSDWLKRKRDELDDRFGPRVPPGGVRDEIHKLPKGKNNNVYEVESEEEMQDLFKRLTRGGDKVDQPNYPGHVVKRSDGTIIRMRSSSKSGGSTIDIQYPDGTIEKVHLP
ncbi:WXG100 family type VII secretion target [Janibacter indicus]|uniref:WXG100 family type VII secretion target n=1 Tax=Janibacter indicus TaxID=857417 RepID=UPI003EB769A4